MQNPKITVVIPTRERADTLDASLRTATSQNYDNLEIIVCDNASHDATADVVAAARDRRVRYLNTGTRLSMAHNWEFALSHVEEGWVTFMGDDDGLMPASLSTVAEIICGTQAKAIRSRFCTYDWPGIPERPDGQLIVPLGSGIKVRSSAEWLRRVLQGKQRYNQLPMIYNGGFIHISILKQIKERVGAFFASSNPDVFSAIAAAKMTTNYVFSNEPLALGGTSRHSNGHSAFSTAKERNTDAFKAFINENNIPLHKDIPTSSNGSFPLSLHACVYEAHLQCAELDWSINNVSHQQQLVIILATSGKHKESVSQWGEHFARVHGLDFKAAQRAANRQRYYFESAKLAGKIFRSLNSVIIDSLPIRNIFEASIAAAVIRSKPGRSDSVRFLLRQTRSLFRH